MPAGPVSPYVPAPDADAMQKVQHVWDWYFSVAAAAKMEDIIDYRMMGDLTLIDARPEGRSVWKMKIPRYLCNLNRTYPVSVFQAPKSWIPYPRSRDLIFKAPQELCQAFTIFTLAC